MPQYDEDRDKDISQVSTAPGAERLAGPGGYYGATMEHVVRSSWRWFERNQYRNVPKEANQLATLDFLHSGASLHDWTPSQAGVFNLGVIYDPEGELVSSIDSASGMIMPCEIRPHPNSTYSQDLAGITENMADTLDVIGLSNSKDYGQGCSGYPLLAAMGYGCKWYSTDQSNLLQYYKRTKPKSWDYKRREMVAKSVYHDCRWYSEDHRRVGVPQWKRIYIPTIF